MFRLAFVISLFFLLHKSAEGFSMCSFSSGIRRCASSPPNRIIASKVGPSARSNRHALVSIHFRLRNNKLPAVRSHDTARKGYDFYLEGSSEEILHCTQSGWVSIRGKLAVGVLRYLQDILNSTSSESGSDGKAQPFGDSLQNTTGSSDNNKFPAMVHNDDGLYESFKEFYSQIGQRMLQEIETCHQSDVKNQNLPLSDFQRTCLFFFNTLPIADLDDEDKIRYEEAAFYKTVVNNLDYHDVLKYYHVHGVLPLLCANRGNNGFFTPGQSHDIVNVFRIVEPTLKKYFPEESERDLFRPVMEMFEKSQTSDRNILIT